MLGDFDRSARSRFDGRRRGALGRRLAWLAVIVPALLVAGVAQSAMLTNVGPRLPTSIGPRSPTLNTIGPRFDPTFHTAPGGGGYSGGGSTGGSNAGNSNNPGGSHGSAVTRSHATARRGVEFLGFDETAGAIRARLKKADGSSETCEVFYLAGCDGARSTVREALQIDFAGDTYAHLFYVADVHASGAAMDGEAIAARSRLAR